MATVRVRRQGGAAIITIPADVAKALGITVGTELDIAVVDGTISARPRPVPQRKRYTLKELLSGATPDGMRELADETAWAREGDPVGREI